jgi:hypothetical protein
MFKASKRSFQEVVQILNWEIEQSIHRVVEKLEESEEQETSFIIQIKNSSETKEIFIHCDGNGTAEIRSSVAETTTPIKMKDANHKPAKAKKLTSAATRKTLVDIAKADKDGGSMRPPAEASLAPLDAALDSQ